MNFYYSKNTDAFYPEEYKKSYTTAGSWPDDLVKVDEQSFTSYGLQTPPDGKVRTFLNGVFTWEDVVLTEDQSSQRELSWVATEIIRVREELEKVQDSDPTATGSVADWRNYRKELRSWKDNVSFPKTNLRPKSPDFKE